MKIRILLFLVFTLLGITQTWGQDVLAGWTFPTAPISTATLIAAECGEKQASANIYMNGTNGSSSFSGITGFGGHSPTVVNQVCSVTIATQALAIVGTVNNNKGIVFKFPTTGYEDLKLTYSTRGSDTGYSQHVWSYSTNGTSFTDIKTITGRTSTSFTTQEVDFSSVSALDNQAFVYIKVTISGASKPEGNNRFDNIKFVGTAITVTDYTVTFNGNGSTSGTMANQISSTPANLYSNTFTRTGYIFSNWHTTASGTGGTTYTDGQNYD